jgi:hypothetical protein
MNLKAPRNKFPITPIMLTLMISLLLSISALFYLSASQMRSSAQHSITFVYHLNTRFVKNRIKNRDKPLGLSLNSFLKVISVVMYETILVDESLPLEDLDDGTCFFSSFDDPSLSLGVADVHDLNISKLCVKHIEYRIADRMKTIEDSGTEIITIDEETYNNMVDASSSVRDSIEKNVDPEICKSYIR